MKTRRKTKFGMCIVEKCGDPRMRKVTFDEKTSLRTNGVSTETWILSLETLASISKHDSPCS